MNTSPECLCRNATAFRLSLYAVTRLELHLHGPDGRGRPRPDCPTPLRHGFQGQEPASVQHAEEQAVLILLLPPSEFVWLMPRVISSIRLFLFLKSGPIVNLWKEIMEMRQQRKAYIIRKEIRNNGG